VAGQRQADREKGVQRAVAVMASRCWCGGAAGLPGSRPAAVPGGGSLGAGPLDPFFTVSLPLARHGVVAGVLLAFARGLGEFGATLMVAGSQEQTRTLAIQVYDLHNLPRRGV